MSGTGSTGSGIGPTGSTGSGTTGRGSSGALASGASGSGTGTSGSSGTGSAGSSGTTAPTAGNSVLQRGNNAARNGNYVQPTLTKAAAKAMMMPDAAFNTAATFTGNVYSTPLYLDTGPGNPGAGFYIVTTTGNDVLTFSDTGTAGWTKNIGSSPKSSGACGNVNPIGIEGTPIIDPTAGADGYATIYVVGAIGPAAGNTDHQEVHALSAKDGTERTGWPVKIDDTVMATNDGMNLAFAASLNQRGALSLVDGMLYVPFGGQDGDCGPYHGWVIAVDTTKAAVASSWATRGVGGAIWAAGGMASDGTGVFAVTGNANYEGHYMPPPTYSDSEGIIRVSGMPLTRTDHYYPVRWGTMDSGDQDMGASSSLYMTVPGATPSGYVVTVSKDGHLYFLDSQSLGGTGTMSGMNQPGGEAIDLEVAGIIHSVRTSAVPYTTATATYVAITIDRDAMGCPATPVANINEGVLMALTVAPSTKPSLKVAPAWCDTIQGNYTPPVGQTIGQRTPSPLVTTSDGKSDAIVWIMGGAGATTLYGFDGDTGATIYTGGTCPGGVNMWTVPIAVKGHIVVAGGGGGTNPNPPVKGHLCSWSVQ
jgi:hypothetical protein